AREHRSYLLSEKNRPLRRGYGRIAPINLAPPLSPSPSRFPGCSARLRRGSLPHGRGFGPRSAGWIGEFVPADVWKNVSDQVTGRMTSVLVPAEAVLPIP